MKRWLFGLILSLFLFSCAGTSPKPEEGPCKPGEIFFGIDTQGWKWISKDMKAHPVYVYRCTGNDQGDALGLEVFYDGYRYQLFGKKYKHLGTFKDFTEVRDFLLHQKIPNPEKGEK